MSFKDLRATINLIQIEDLRRSKHYSKHLYNYKYFELFEYFDDVK